jgi:hypothetical protein
MSIRPSIPALGTTLRTIYDAVCAGARDCFQCSQRTGISSKACATALSDLARRRLIVRTRQSEVKTMTPWQGRMMTVWNYGPAGAKRAEHKRAALPAGKYPFDGPSHEWQDWTVLAGEGAALRPGNHSDLPHPWKGRVFGNAGSA